MIATEQIKAARMMLDLKQVDLAKRAGVSVATLNNIERGAQTDPKTSTMKAICGALEKLGIEFINDPLGGKGVLLKPQKTSTRERTVLIVDDSKSDRTLYKRWLQEGSKAKYRIVEAESAGSGFNAFLECKPDCVILDFMMYGADGFQLLAAIKREHIALPPIIFVTGLRNAIMDEVAKAHGVHTYLDKKTLRPEELVNAVMEACEQHASVN